MQMRGTSNCMALCCRTLPSHFERWDGSGRCQPLRCISVAQSLLSLQNFLSAPLKRVCGSSSRRLPPQSLGDLGKILGTLFWFPRFKKPVTNDNLDLWEEIRRSWRDLCSFRSFGSAPKRKQIIYRISYQQDNSWIELFLIIMLNGI